MAGIHTDKKAFFLFLKDLLKLLWLCKQQEVENSTFKQCVYLFVYFYEGPSKM